MNYLYEFQKLGKDTEIPGIFVVWGGVATLSAMLSRRVYVDMGTFTIYPNLFIVLVAGSGKCRKSTMIEMVEDQILPFSDDINLLVDKGTFQGISDDLRKVGELAPGTELESHQGYMILDEVTTLLNKQSWEGRVGELLHQLIDCKKSFRARTRGKGVEELKNTCLGAFGGTTIELIRDAIPPQMIGAGLSSRMIFVYTDQPGPPCAKPEMTPEKREALEKIHKKLKHTLTVEGQMEFSEEAEAYYQERYNDHYYNCPFWDEPNLWGYASRRYVFVIKLAMLLSIAEGDGLVIEKSHIQGAENLIFETEKNLPKVVGKMGQSNDGELTDYVMSVIRQRGKITRTDLTLKVKNRLKSKELDEILDTLRESGEVSVSSNGRATCYIAN